MSRLTENGSSMSLSSDPSIKYSDADVLELLHWLEMTDRLHRPKVTSVLRYRLRMIKLTHVCPEAKPVRKPQDPAKVVDLLPSEFEDVLGYIVDNVCRDRPARLLSYIADLLDECMDERALYCSNPI